MKTRIPLLLMSTLTMTASLVLPVPADAAADLYTIDGAHTIPYFLVSHLIFSTQHGRFDKTSGKVMLDMAAKKGTVDITIDASSIDTADAKRDEHLRGEDFFNVQKFPTITFKSDKLKFKGDKLVGAEGELTLLGVTKPVKLKFSRFNCGENVIYKKFYCGGDASTTIKRSEFGMTKFAGAIGDEVTIHIPVDAAKGPKAGPPS
jgi:polyisoprenoid-binding protein YceI